MCNYLQLTVVLICKSWKCVAPVDTLSLKPPRSGIKSIDNVSSMNVGQ